MVRAFNFSRGMQRIALMQSVSMAAKVFVGLKVLSVNEPQLLFLEFFSSTNYHYLCTHKQISTDCSLSGRTIC